MGLAKEARRKWPFRGPPRWRLEFGASGSTTDPPSGPGSRVARSPKKRSGAENFEKRFETPSQRGRFGPLSLPGKCRANKPPCEPPCTPPNEYPHFRKMPGKCPENARKNAITPDRGPRTDGGNMGRGALCSGLKNGPSRHKCSIRPVDRPRNPAFFGDR
ncbi:hypothetical protein M885DRAFT_532677 [Pelagophyceae sp. CCMP2097]|nr:hypothetical protein M885DRAFT_532677 [Pelagophyceae sp. CCMP2097]